MSDAVLAVGSGLLGAIAAGGVQAGLTAWADFKDRRAAGRLVATERLGLLGRVEFVLRPGHTAGAALLAEPHVLAEHEVRLARELSKMTWSDVQAAYASYALLRHKATVKLAEPLLRAQAEKAAALIREAIMSLGESDAAKRMLQVDSRERT